MSFMDDFLLASAGIGSNFYPVSIPYSCRFDSTRSCKLTRTPGATGNRYLWTRSIWFKAMQGPALQRLFQGVQDGSHYTGLWLQADGHIAFISGTGQLVTTQVFRDPSSWYNIQVIYDSANSTATNRMRMYLNGVRITAFDTIINPALNEVSYINTISLPDAIGSNTTNDSYLNGYLADFYSIDGAALDPTTFGQFSAQNPNVWVPKTPSGLSYGTNGFHLAFGNAAALGTDTSGQGNNYTSSGLTTADQFADTPTNNACVLNALTGSGALSEGNLKMAAGARQGTFFVSAGTWAWKYTQTAAGNLGVITPSGTKTAITGANNDVIEVELDLDAGTLKKRVNSGVLTSVATGLSGLYAPYFEAPGTVQFIGFTPTDATRKALCSANLPDPAVIDSTKGFDAKLYTGTGAAQNITGFNFQPDLIWQKSRLLTQNNTLTDSVRGVGNQISSNLPDAEWNVPTAVTAFLSNGWAQGSGGLNTNAESYASWCWKKGAAYGFDIVSFVGTGANRTVAHNLGAVPELMIFKNRDVANRSWWTYHKNANASPQNYVLYLDQTLAAAADATFLNNTAPTSTVFTVGTAGGVNENTKKIIAYLFRSVPGFSLIGSYLGNGSVDGPFVYCGFRPRYIMVKRTDTAGDWCILDAARDTYNGAQKFLYPNGTYAEQSSIQYDFLSNGFKLKGTATNTNTSGATYIFAAFAEAPFKYANAR